MPPRFAYWTILIDDTPTAFRAREAEELLPTFNQLKRTNSNVVMKWFSGGQLWSSPEAAREARRRPPVPAEKRGAQWRPGGAHADPRDRFKKKPRDADRKPWQGKPSAPSSSGKPWHGKPSAPMSGERPWSQRPSGPRSANAWKRLRARTRPVVRNSKPRGWPLSIPLRISTTGATWPMLSVESVAGWAGTAVSSLA